MLPHIHFRRRAAVTSLVLAMGTLLVHTASWAAKVPTIAKLKHAKVFLTGATLSAEGSVKLPKGLHTVVVTKMPYSVDYESVEVKGRGNLVVMGFRYSSAPPPPVKPVNLQGKEKLIAQLKDSITFFAYRMEEASDLTQEATNQMAALRTQQSAIRQNDVAAQKALLEYLESRLNSQRQQLFRYRNQYRTLDKRKQEKQALLDYLTNGGDPAYYGKPQPEPAPAPEMQPDTLPWNGPLNDQLEIQVEMLEAGVFDFDLRYNVSSARWVPMYDIKVNPGKGPARIQYRAQVSQQTGLNWNNVKLTLSTTTPSANRVVPTLNPYTVGLYENRPQPQPMYKSVGKARRADQAPQVQQLEAVEDAGTVSYKMAAATAEDFTAVVETSISAEYEINLSYSVPSNNEGQRIDIKTLEAQARYEHASVPKMDAAAFLVGYLKGWESFSLIPGNAKIYLDDSYVGEAYMTFDSPDEELQLSLARDPAISVKRENKAVKKRGPSMLESSNVKPYHWETTFRNNRKDAIELVVKDQIPLAGHEQLKVEDQKLDGGELEAETGIVTWKFKLKPGETRKLSLRYNLVYPKKMILQE